MIIPVKIGDVRIFEGDKIICDSVNQSGSRWILTNAGCSIINGELKTNGKYIHLANTCEEGSLMERLGVQGLNNLIEQQSQSPIKHGRKAKNNLLIYPQNKKFCLKDLIPLNPTVKKHNIPPYIKKYIKNGEVKEVERKSMGKGRETVFYQSV